MQTFGRLTHIHKSGTFLLQFSTADISDAIL